MNESGRPLAHTRHAFREGSSGDPVRKPAADVDMRLSVAFAPHPDRLQALLGAYVEGPGRTLFAPSPAEWADTMIADIDHAPARAAMLRYREATGHPCIVLAQHDPRLPGAAWVPKPVSFEGLARAAAERAGVLGRNACKAAGVIWLALGDAGLWRLAYQRGADAMAGERLTPQGDTVYRVGLGKAAPDAEVPALYINGILRGAYGFYRSLDGGRHFDRINGERQMYGDIRSIAGDPREFGRYYIATGTRGVLYGEPLEDV